MSGYKLNIVAFIYFTAFGAFIDARAQSSFLVIKPSPDLTITDLQNKEVNSSNSPWKLDIDNNGIMDLTISAFYTIGSGSQNQYVSLSTGDSCTFSGATGKGYAVTAGTTDTIFFTSPIVKILNPADTVFSNNCTLNSSDFSRYSNPAPGKTQGYIGEWISGVHYAGIRKVIGNNEYLGWIKVDVKSYMSIVLKELGIQTIPVGIGEISGASVSIHPNPATTELHLKGLEKCKKIELYNALGSLIGLMENKNSSSVLSMDISNFQAGIYFVKVFEKDSENYSAKKIIKQ